MISCEWARQTVNLYVSVIKFLDFEGFVWSGDSLPLAIESLGEIFQIQVRLKSRGGGKTIPAFYERGQLFAVFKPNEIYDLSLRLEYHGPVQIRRFKSDFVSIHPKSYQVALDFSHTSVKDPNHRAVIDLGDQSHHLEIEENSDLTLASLHRIRFRREHDYCSLSVSMSGDSPYAHSFFPAIRV